MTTRTANYPVETVERQQRSTRSKTPETDNYFIASISGVTLPEDSPIRRDSPRPLERRRPDYEEKFDWLSLFYDVFWSGGRLTMVGPPLRNLASLVAAENLRLDGIPVPAATTLDFGCVNVSFAPSETMPERLDIDCGWYRTSAAIKPSQAKVFSGRKVLCTISKDNRLPWIADWADFHVKAHGADAILFYDNASTSYTTDDLLSLFRSIPGLKVAVVVPWTYKFGPMGNGSQDWDSHYAQCVMLEHARRRFLQEATAMVNLDVDELVVTDDGVSLFEHLARSPVGALIYPGRWIRNLRNLRPGHPRHRYYRYYSTMDAPYPTKWTVVPSRLADNVEAGLHEISGMTPDKDPAITFRHFKAISTSWHYPRMRVESFDSECHKVDDGLVRQMRSIGWVK